MADGAGIEQGRGRTRLATSRRSLVPQKQADTFSLYTLNTLRKRLVGGIHVAGLFVLIVGCPAEKKDELSETLRTHARGIAAKFHATIAPEAEKELVQKSAAAVCFATTPPGESQIIDSTRRWAKLYPDTPVVIFGLSHSTPPADRPAGVFLRPDASLMNLAQVVGKIVFDGSDSQLGIPRLVVDAQGSIIYANGKAHMEFPASGPGLVGRPYLEAIEGAGGPMVPEDHPIHLVFRDGQLVNRYREWAGEKGEWHRAFLICTPLRFEDERIRAVDVQVRQMDRWERVSAAGMALARARTHDALHQAVVEEARKLGYPRARVKEFEQSKAGRGEDCLRGKASIGLDAETEMLYRTSYRIRRKEDPAAFECLEKSHALLFVSKDDTSLPNSDLVWPYDLRYQDKMVGNEHARWIDAPIILRGEGKPPERWGVLTVDYGGDSSHLGIIDAAELASFASVVGTAYREMKLRQTRFRESVESYRTYAHELVKVLSDEKPTTSVLPGVIQSLLAFYQRTTRADVVLYHEFRSGKLVLAGEKWKEDRKSDGVPKEFEKGQGFSASFLNQVDGEGKKKSGESLQPIIHRDTREQVRTDLAQAGHEAEHELYSSREVLLYRSAAYIPVVVNDRLRGVIAALSSPPNAFPPQMQLERAGEHAWLGVTLAELYDTNRWWSQVLGNIGSLFRKLAEAPRQPQEEAFFAGLATMLTFGDGGLGWNRCLIWSTNSELPDTAELVYALGGCGKRDHVARQEGVTAKYGNRLEEVVSLRIERPPPEGKDKNGDITLDPLYEAYVLELRKKKEPIRFTYGHAGAQPTTAGPAKVAISNPLQWLLEPEYMRTQREATCAVWLEKEKEGWLQVMEQQYPGLFCAERAYAFPVWCAYEHSPEPLGIVVVDMSYSHDDRPEERVAATGLVVGLAAEILASRNQELRLRAGLGKLPDIMHPVRGHPHFPTAWGVFTNALKALLDIAQDLPRFEERDEAQLLNDIRTSLDQINPAVLSYLRAQEATKKRIAGPEGMNHIEELGSHLDAIERHYREFPGYEDYLTFGVEWDESADRNKALPCDKEIFRDVLHFLVQNAVEAARRKSLPSVRVTVTVSLHTIPPGYALAERVCLSVKDTGPGIPKAIKDLIFHNSFSHQHPPAAPDASPSLINGRGKGLALARCLLFSCHGDLRLIDPGVTEEDAKATSATLRGATFEIAFGIPHPKPEPKGVQTHEQGTSSRRRGAAEAGHRTDREESRL